MTERAAWAAPWPSPNASAGPEGGRDPKPLQAGVQAPRARGAPGPLQAGLGPLAGRDAGFPGPGVLKGHSADGWVDGHSDVQHVGRPVPEVCQLSRVGRGRWPQVGQVQDAEPTGHPGCIPLTPSSESVPAPRSPLISLGLLPGLTSWHPPGALWRSCHPASNCGLPEAPHPHGPGLQAQTGHTRAGLSVLCEMARGPVCCMTHSATQLRSTGQMDGPTAAPRPFPVRPC